MADVDYGTAGSHVGRTYVLGHVQKQEPIDVRLDEVEKTFLGLFNGLHFLGDEGTYVCPCCRRGRIRRLRHRCIVELHRMQPQYHLDARAWSRGKGSTMRCREKTVTL